MTKEFNFKVSATEDYYVTATSEDKARSKAIRKRNSSVDSYASIYRAPIENLGEAEKSRASASDLVELLKEQTQMLKEEYLKKTEAFAANIWNEYLPYRAWTGIEWFQEDHMEEFTFVDRRGKSHQNNRLTHRWANNRKQTEALRRFNTAQEFFDKEIERATNHYNNSMTKLAMRIVAKGLNENKMEMVTARIGVNVETTITDGEVTVRAWTIVASGPIQRPHYRYIVK